MKRCSHCRRDLPVGDFNRCASKPDGLWVQCRVCQRTLKRQWSAKNSRHILDYTAQYRLTHGDAVRAGDRARYKSNPTPKRERANRRYQLNPAAAIRNVKAYRLREPQKAKVHQVNAKARRRARVGGDERLTTVQWRMLVERDRVCYLCQRPNRAATNSLDHVTPLAHGGLHVIQNMRVVHLRCNIRKGARLVLLPFWTR